MAGLGLFTYRPLQAGVLEQGAWSYRRRPEHAADQPTGPSQSEPGGRPSMPEDRY